MSCIDFRKKVCLIGDPSVGKTSLIQRFVYDKFDDSYLSTLGVKVSKKLVNLEVKSEQLRVSLQIWDTMGQREYRPLLVQYFKGAEGAMIVSDVTSRPTLESTEEWSKLLFSVTGRIPVIYLVNKIDLHKQAQFSPSDLNTLVTKYGVGFFPTSAKTGLNVQEAFEALSKALVSDICTDSRTNDLRSVAHQIADLFCSRHGGEDAAMPMVRQQFRRANLDYDHLDRLQLTTAQLQAIIDNLVEISRAFKGEEFARVERLEFIKILKRVELSN